MVSLLEAIVREKSFAALFLEIAPPVSALSRIYTPLVRTPRARPICQEKLCENDVDGLQSCFSMFAPVTLSSDVTTKVNCPAKDGVSQYRTNHLHQDDALVNQDTGAPITSTAKPVHTGRRAFASLAWMDL